MIDFVRKLNVLLYLKRKIGLDKLNLMYFLLEKQMIGLDKQILRERFEFHFLI